MLELEISPSR